MAEQYFTGDGRPITALGLLARGLPELGRFGFQAKGKGVRRRFGPISGSIFGPIFFSNFSSRFRYRFLSQNLAAKFSQPFSSQNLRTRFPDTLPRGDFGFSAPIFGSDFRYDFEQSGVRRVSKILNLRGLSEN